MLDGFMDRLGTDLRQRDAPDLPRLSVLVHHAKGHLHGHGLVAPRKLKLVDLLAALELGDTVIERPSRAGLRAVGAESRPVDPALDVQDDLVGVFRVLFEVALEQDKTVVGLRTVELAAVPKGAYQKTPSVYIPTVNGQKQVLHLQPFRRAARKVSKA